jgi:hypothetical protein
MGGRIWKKDLMFWKGFVDENSFHVIVPQDGLLSRSGGGGGEMRIMQRTRGTLAEAQSGRVTISRKERKGAKKSGGSRRGGKTCFHFV